MFERAALTEERRDEGTGRHACLVSCFDVFALTVHTGIPPPSSSLCSIGLTEGKEEEGGGMPEPCPSFGRARLVNCERELSAVSASPSREGEAVHVYCFFSHISACPFGAGADVGPPSSMVGRAWLPQRNQACEKKQVREGKGYDG